ncbi:MAG: YraN family protein [Ruthenibacterium sp.]
MNFTQMLGGKGEQKVAAHYRKQGYAVVAQNYRTRQGEIDIIARKGNVLVLIEVKTRSKNTIAAPCEFVTPAKQRKLILAAQAYLQEINDDTLCVRFDVAEVFADEKNRIHCIENAFTL